MMLKKNNRRNLNISKLQQQDAARGLQENPVAENALNEYMPLVHTVAATLFKTKNIPPAVVFDDLTSWGMEGLLKAYRRFDKDKGTQFKTYAYYRIRGEILDKLRQEWIYRSGKQYSVFKKALRNKISDYIETACEEKDHKAPTFDQLVDDSMMIQFIESQELSIESHYQGTRDPSLELIDENTDIEESMLWNHIKGLEKDEELLVELLYIQGLKQNEVADKMSMSKSKICRLHQKVLTKLRKKVESSSALGGIYSND